MDITDYIPNIFGAAAPTSYEGLQTMGLITPQQLAQQQKTANIQGLLGAGLALAQGMSRIGPRRSAAENILGALAGGFGAAGGAYQQGIQNIVQQQQLQSAALQQAQAATKLRSIAEAKAKYPDLAPLFDIDAGKAMEQVLLREQAKMYGFGVDYTQDQIPAQMPTQAPAQVPQENVQQGLLAVPSFGVPTFETVTAPSAVPAIATAPVLAPAISGTQQQNVPLIDPANVAKANDARRKLAIAIYNGNQGAINYFKDEIERLDPKEVISFRDGMAFSNKRGLIANYGGTRQLTAQEVKDKDLDPTKRYQVGLSGNITEIPTTAKTRILSPEEAKEKGFRTKEGQIWQVDASNNYSVVKGTEVASDLNKEQLIASLPTQANNIYPTLQPRFDALIKRAHGMTPEQINSELTSILEANANILKELDPTLFQQDIKKTIAGRPQNIINLSDPAKRAQALSENSARYIGNKNVSESFEVATRFNNFVEAYNNPAAAGASDAVLIYSMAKMLDPGGAVQQGDIGTIAGQKSIPDKLKSIHQQFINSRILSDDQRKDLNAMAYSIMQNKRKSLQPVIKQYRNYATDLQSPDPEVDVQDPFSSIKLPKNRVVTINGKRTEVRLGNDNNYYYTDPTGKHYIYKD